ncbi:MAG: IS1595 family transposase [Nitrospira sp.]|nr:IS1595 family transposase [Nitrospira sp.]
MRKKAPGKFYRQGISLEELMDRFPNEYAARKWFESIRWPEGRTCPHCASTDTKPVPNENPMPYHCTTCRQYFSVKTGTVMASSNLKLRKWVIGFYLMSTNLKGVSSMKLHRDLKITQKTAWMMGQKIRQAWNLDHAGMIGPVEVDETYIGGKDKNKHAKKKRERGNAYGVKQAVVGMKSRVTNQVAAQPVDPVSAKTLQRFVTTKTEGKTQVYSDTHRGYWGLRKQGYGLEQVNHSAGEYVRDMAHTNGIESFWALLKRGYHGTFHKMSVKHLHRYVTEFAGRHNIRTLDTIEQMTILAQGVVGKRLPYRDLIA